MIIRVQTSALRCTFDKSKAQVSCDVSGICRSLRAAKLFSAHACNILKTARNRLSRQRLCIWQPSEEPCDLQVGMPIDDFTKETMESLDNGELEFSVGMASGFVATVNHDNFEQMFQRMCGMSENFLPALKDK